VVEVGLEWKEEKGSQMPDVFLDRLSQGLFTDFGQMRRARHPYEDFASTILGASSGMKVVLPGGGELSLDRKGIKQLQAESADGRGK